MPSPDTRRRHHRLRRQEGACPLASSSTSTVAIVAQTRVRARKPSRSRSGGRPKKDEGTANVRPPSPRGAPAPEGGDDRRRVRVGTDVGPSPGRIPPAGATDADG